MTKQTRTAVIERRKVVAQVLAGVPEALVISGLGSPSYDVFAAGDRAGNFYLWGAMGGAAAMGLGLALAQPTKSVLVITGDGEQLMGIGALGTIAAKQPRNLTIVVLDNGHYGETGMQQSHSSLGMDFVAVSKGFGIANSYEVWKGTEYARIIESVNSREETTFAQVHIRSEEPARVLPPRDGVYMKNRFRAALGFQPF